MHATSNGVALVKAWPDGRTDPGWGMTPGKWAGPDEHFMPKYMKGEFNPRRVLFGYERGRWNFAIVMRSVHVVCIDIDGKNGGIEGAKRLGRLPWTLAETSKSGTGFHLFYSTNALFDDVKGFEFCGDAIGIEQGVDIRDVGCVYHHPQQRWNDSAIAPLPDHLSNQLLHRKRVQLAQRERVEKILGTGDPMDTLMLQDELITDLKKPIDSGKRNNTLFAIGQKMKQAAVPDWEDHISERAHQLGLDTDEIEKLLKNISTYN